MACNLRKTKLGNSRPAKRALEQIASYSAQIAADCHDVSRLDQAIEDLRERLDAQTLDKPLDAYCRARVAGRAPPSLPRPLSRRYRQDVADLAANTERGHLYRCLHLRRPTDLRTFIAHPLAAAFRECFGVEPGLRD